MWRWLIPLAACEPSYGPLYTWPDPGAWGPTAGPGAPQRTFSEAELFQPCAWLLGGPEDVEHHNLVVMVDGYLLMPWAPEDGGGGISFFDVSDPCAPVEIGRGYSDLMRESHTIGLRLGPEARYAAVDYLEPDGSGGVGIWDITDPSAPAWVSQIAVPGHMYPDSYTRLTLSVNWQGRYIYASTTTRGVYVIDAADPLNLSVAGQITFDGPHIVGSFLTVGNFAMAASAGVARTVLVDISDPLVAAPIPGGDFNTRDADAQLSPYYFSNLGQHWGLFARSKEGGGPLVYDLRDPSYPTFVSAVPSADGDGGYVFQQNDRLFVGDSELGTIFDFSDPAAPALIGAVRMPGDLDTVTPVGNVAVVSVDEKGEPGRSSGVFPWSVTPDTDPPRPGLTYPRPGSRFQATTSRIGVAFDEMIEPVSAFDGSFRVVDERGRKVLGSFSVAENVVTFIPDAPLRAGTTFLVGIPAGGLVDLSGNTLEETYTFRFETAP